MTLPGRDNLKRMLASLDVAIASAGKHQLDDDDLRTTLRASVRVLMLEASEADRDWVKGQLEELLAGHGMKDFEL